MTINGTMRAPMLDARLQCVMDLVPACLLAADIGADHGKLALHLLKSGRCQRLMVTDISSASLKKAEQLLSRHALDDKATFVVADGLPDRQEKPEVIVVSGMGGKTIAGILRRGKDRLGDAQLVLSAQTELPVLRQELADIGYRIHSEHVLRVDNRFYSVIHAARGQATCSRRERYVGVSLTPTQSAGVSDYLQWRLDVLLCQRGEDRAQKESWLREEIASVQGKRQDNP